MTRSEIHKLFVFEFHQGEGPTPVSASDIHRIEQELATVLPHSYVAFMEMHGSVHTPLLLSLIVDRDLEQPDVKSILTLAKVIETTRGYRSAGMSEDLVGFASDCMGNLFCFRGAAPGSPRADDSAVWFFDHDFCSDSKVADSFDEWLLSYLKLKREDLSR